MTDTTRDAGSSGETTGMSPADALPSQLSAFMDDQLPAAESDLFVRRLVRDADMKQCMSRYLLIGEAIRQPSNRRVAGGVSRDFSARVAAALEQDPVAEKATRNSRSTILPALWKNVAGLAVAAGVAVVAVLVVRQPGQLSGDNMAATGGTSSAMSDSYIVPVAANSPAAPIPAARLTNYVVAHSEFSSPLGRQNLMTGLLSEDHQIAEAQVSANANDFAESARTAVVSH